MTGVRRAVEGDVDALLDLTVAVAAEDRWIGTEAGFDQDARRTFLRQAVEVDDRVIFVAEADGRVVGWIAVGETHRGLHDLGMAVADGYRGRGLGSALLAAGLDWTRNRAGHKLTLEVWPHNEAAVALYRRFGFEIEGRRRRHWRRVNGELWDSLVMGLVLDAEQPGSPHPDAPSASAGLTPTRPRPAPGS